MLRRIRVRWKDRRGKIIREKVVVLDEDYPVDSLSINKIRLLVPEITKNDGISWMILK